MQELTRVRLELPLVLPEIDDPHDPCIARLIALLEGRPGVERVHVKTLEGSPPLLCLHYDPRTITVGRLREVVGAVGAQLTDKFAHYVGNTPTPLHARGARTFAERLRQIPGVLEAEVSPSGKIRVEYERSNVSHAQLAGLVRSFGTGLSESGTATSAPAPGRKHDAGHGKHEHEHEHGKEHEHEHEHEHEKEGDHGGHDHAHGGIFGAHTELIFAAAAGLFVLAGWLVERSGAAASWLPLAMYIGAYLCGGYFTAKEAIENILARRFEIDTLMLVAAVGAAALGKWAEGGLLLFLFSLGHSLEHFAMGRARRAIEALAKLAPETALLKKGDRTSACRLMASWSRAAQASTRRRSLAKASRSINRQSTMAGPPSPLSSGFKPATGYLPGPSTAPVPWT
jgi:Cd2+/Zn2+-exporting ATPase